jgi:predicted MPP superfamily phosphohydrolase
VKLRIVSDLHTEFWGDNGNSEKLLRCLELALPSMDDDKETTLILAGDTFAYSSRKKAEVVMPALESRFKNVVAVSGNHEPWGGSYDEAKAYYDKFNVKTSGVYDGGGDHLIVAATLWTDFANGNPLALNNAANCMRDYEFIEGFTPEQALEIFKSDLRFLYDYVSPGDVVVTHHAPSHKSVANRFRGSDSNVYFASALEDVIEDLKPSLWIHGHMHNCSDYMVGDTRIICNPHGYKGWEMTGYNKTLTVEI